MDEPTKAHILQLIAQYDAAQAQAAATANANAGAAEALRALLTQYPDPPTEDPPPGPTTPTPESR